MKLYYLLNCRSIIIISIKKQEERIRPKTYLCSEYMDSFLFSASKWCIERSTHQSKCHMTTNDINYNHLSNLLNYSLVSIFYWCQNQLSIRWRKRGIRQFVELIMQIHVSSINPHSARVVYYVLLSLSLTLCPNSGTNIHSINYLYFFINFTKNWKICDNIYQPGRCCELGTAHSLLADPSSILLGLSNKSMNIPQQCEYYRLTLLLPVGMLVSYT